MVWPPWREYALLVWSCILSYVAFLPALVLPLLLHFFQHVWWQLRLFCYFAGAFLTPLLITKSTLLLTFNFHLNQLEGLSLSSMFAIGIVMYFFSELSSRIWSLSLSTWLILQKSTCAPRVTWSMFREAFWKGSLIGIEEVECSGQNRWRQMLNEVFFYYKTKWWHSWKTCHFVIRMFGLVTHEGHIALWEKYNVDG